MGELFSAVPPSYGQIITKIVATLTVLQIMLPLVTKAGYTTCTDGLVNNKCVLKRSTSKKCDENEPATFIEIYDFPWKHYTIFITT